MQKRRERIAAFLFEDQKIAAFGSSYRGSRSNVGAAEGCDLLKLDAVSLKHRAPHNSAVNPAKELPMAFKLIEHGTGDLILGETQMQKRRERIAAFLFVQIFSLECLQLWRGSLLPLECAALANSWGRFATQREQAPSPQQLYRITSVLSYKPGQGAADGFQTDRARHG